jgi:hypothetical protein
MTPSPDHRPPGSGPPDPGEFDACLQPGAGGAYELSEHGVRGPLSREEAIRRLESRLFDLVTEEFAP